ncbi:hypothetical protein MSAN_02451800 [Mycena sanguinolenta]|uniref:Uncharacterized protein n=1 Tax=Mycena sanguinolenta TaxID=230812 RepID=A0A8H6WY07_9AGAR|nr:hypothetical protein MSAN_02451800 [Mycena sanguinolenta]
MAPGYCNIYVFAASFIDVSAIIYFLTTRPDIRILFRSVAPQVQMAYTPRFSMTISYPRDISLIVIEIPILRQYIFMRTSMRISRKSAIILSLNSAEPSGHGNLQTGYVFQMAGFAQSLPQPVITCGFTGIHISGFTGIHLRLQPYRGYIG